MVDENSRQTGSSSGKSSVKLRKQNRDKNKSTGNQMPAATNQSEKVGASATSGADSATAKRRRSLFSVLFQKSNKSTSEESEGAEKTAPAKTKHEPVDMKSEICKSDIVLVRASEAKCIEATIESIQPTRTERQLEVRKVQDKSKDRKNSNQRSSKIKDTDNQNSDPQQQQQQQQQQKHSLRRLIKRGGSSKSKSKRRDEDADSYVLDLNDQLELEKLRISSSSSSASSSSSSSSASLFEPEEELTHAIESRNGKNSKFAPITRTPSGVRREMSPADATWRTNQNYIPCDSDKPAMPPPRPPPPTFAAKQAARSGLPGIKGKTTTPLRPAPPAADRKRQKSPLLQEFLTSHRIDPLAAASSDEEDETRASSCDSLSYLSRIPLQNLNTANLSLTSARNAASLARVQPADLISESDRRLYHWRKLAERSVTMWQVPHDSSCSEDSLAGSDDEQLELLNCDSPALVCYCSDDTSCSSVELIWSRPQLQARQRQQNEMRRRDQLNLNSSRDSFVSQQFSSKRDFGLAPGRRAAGSVSPRQLMPTPSPASNWLTPNRMFLQANHNINNNNDNSCSSLVSCDSNLSGRTANNNNNHSDNNMNSRRQKPAVLELAKPSRARDRRIGERRKSDAGQRRRRHIEESRASASSRASDEWHPNPLFGPHGRASRSPPLKSSPIEVAPNMRASLRRGQSIDLLNCEKQIEQAEAQEAELTKSNRFMNFLARIKKLESAPGSSGKSCDSIDGQPDGDTKKENDESAKEETAAKRASLDDEDLDRFSVNESSFDANERVKRHRWSLRMRSPFTANQTANQSNNNTPYLGQHLINLDRRIKSNVSSLKSHLHDTGKRASVLADQLITSIKDTTKEQLISATTGSSARDRYDTMPNSFAKPNSGDNSQNTTIDHRRAKQFALIYMHQQSQASGQPVITKQPVASETSIRPSNLPSTTSELTSEQEKVREPKVLASDDKELEAINIEEIMAECKRRSDAALESKDKSVITSETQDTNFVQAKLPTAAVREAVDTCQTNAKIPEIQKPKRPPPPPAASLKKRLRARKTRRQINVAPQSDDEDNSKAETGDGTGGGNQVKLPRRKYSLNDQFQRQVVCEHRCQSVTN